MAVWELGISYNTTQPTPIWISGWNSGSRIINKDPYLVGDLTTQYGRGGFALFHDTLDASDDECTNLGGWLHRYWSEAGTSGAGWGGGLSFEPGGNGCRYNIVVWARRL